MKRFKHLSHTADIGLEVFGSTLPRVFENSAAGLFSLITDLNKIEHIQSQRIELESSSTEDLLVDWLNELLYLHESRNMVFGQFTINELDEKSLKATVKGETFNNRKHPSKLVVKAVTYYKLKITKNENWKAQVYFDV